MGCKVLSEPWPKSRITPLVMKPIDWKTSLVLCQHPEPVRQEDLRPSETQMDEFMFKIIYSSELSRESDEQKF